MSIPVVFPNKTEHALALLKTILGCWSGSVWLLLWYAVWSVSSSLIPAGKRFILRLHWDMEAVSISSDNSMPLSCCPVQRWSSWNALRLKAVTFYIFLFVLYPRATSECPSAQDAGFGGSADHAVGELPRVLHTRYAVHHGRVAHCAGLLRSGWHELSWYLIWWGSRQVSGLSMLRV